MPEKEPGQNPNFLQRLGGGRWFGYRRVFSIQRGGFSQRINDPFYSELRLLQALSVNGKRVSTDIVSKQQEERIVDRVAKSINQGMGSPELLIGFAENELEKTDMVLSHSFSYHSYYASPSGATCIDAKKLINLPREHAIKTIEEIEEGIRASIVPAFQAIISRVDPEEGMTFLLRAISSQLFYRGDQLEEREESEEGTGELLSEEETGGWNWRGTRSVYRVTLDTYRVTTFQAINPWAEVALASIRKFNNNQDWLLQEFRRYHPYGSLPPETVEYKTCIRRVNLPQTRECLPHDNNYGYCSDPGNYFR